MAGLAFLAKKSWHTSNLNNQERVWLAEQKAAAEEKKMKELQQQIKLEREREEFQRLAGKSKSGTGDRGTDWMYQEGGSRPGEEESQEAKDAKMAAEDRKNEEYLLGKHYAPEGQGRHTGDFAVASAIESGALQKASTAGASIGASDGNGAALRLEDAEPAAADGASGQVTEWNQDFHLRHHDPMFAVQQQRLAKLSDVEKKRRLMERAGIDVRLVHRTAGGDDVPAPGGEGGRRARREERKSRKKKSKKRSSKRRRRRSRSRSRSWSRSRSRSASYDSYDRRRPRDGGDGRRRDGWRRRRGGSRSRSRERRRDGSRDSSRSRSRDRDRDRGHDGGRRHARRRTRSRSRSRDRPRLDGGGGGRAAAPPPPPREDPARAPPPRREGYGLIGGGGDVGRAPRPPGGGGLGPDPRLLAARRDEMERERRSNLEQRRRGGDFGPSSREDRLREMERAARER